MRKLFEPTSMSSLQLIFPNHSLVYVVYPELFPIPFPNPSPLPFPSRGLKNPKAYHSQNPSRSMHENPQIPTLSPLPSLPSLFQKKTSTK